MTEDHPEPEGVLKELHRQIAALREERMYAKRLKAYKTLGFEVTTGTKKLVK